MAQKVAFYTLGCKVNQYETEAMHALFADAGYEAVGFDTPADVYVINTCTVTQMSDKKSRQIVSRAHGMNPQAIIAVVGCYAQRAPDEVKSLPGVRLILGTKDRNQIVSLVEEAKQEQIALVSDIQKERTFETLWAAQGGERTRAQLKIQDGCDRYCSYCIIPYARGPVRSRPLEEIATEAQRLAQAGYREIVLTGIHLMSYGKEWNGPVTLLDAIGRVAAVPGIQRIRLGSLEPALIDRDFAQALAQEKKICRQFHLSLQSGSASVLQRMNRRYTPQEYEAAVNVLRNAMPGCAITTDVIAGFVAETQQEHQQTVDFVQRIGFARMHVFPYSKRDGTKAAQMPGHLPKTVKEQRAHELIAISETMEQAYLNEQLGTIQEVLVEEAEQGHCAGYTGNYIYTNFDDSAVKPGEIVTVCMQSLENKTVRALRVI